MLIKNNNHCMTFPRIRHALHYIQMSFVVPSMYSTDVHATASVYKFVCYTSKREREAFDQFATHLETTND